MIGENSRVLSQGDGYLKVPSLLKSVDIWDGTTVIPSEVKKEEISSAIKIKLINGIEIITSKDKTLFQVRKKGNILASDLDNTCLIKLNKESYDFDYVTLEEYPNLSKLSSYELGILSGLVYYLSGDGKILDIPLAYSESWKALQEILNKANIKYEKTLYYKRADRIKYDISDESFSDQFKPFLVTKEIPEIFWQSKILWQGFLKAIFSFSSIGTKMFTIRSGKDTNILKDVQQALLLFGINSTYSRGLKMSQLLVFKNNCYGLAYKIGALNTERFFEGVDFRKFLKYSDINTIDTLYSKVYSVEEIGSASLYSVSGKRFMVNGVILENYE